ncbi:MAG: hypothetical protein H5T97_06095 [Firmicutes bacterium]|nr:hypothetical protein [Bacillota bacterium]
MKMKAERACAAAPFALLAEFDAARERLREAWERFGAAGPDQVDVNRPHA